MSVLTGCVRIKRVDFRENVTAFFPQGHSKLFVIIGVRIKRVDFRENVRAFFPQGHSKLFVIIRCPYKAG